MWKYASLLLMFIVITACSSFNKTCDSVTNRDEKSADVVYIISRGWHTDIAIPVKELGKDLAFYAKIYPGAKVIIFGYGKKTFVTAPPQTISEYILGPVPGPAVIHTIGIRATPLEAYPPEDTIAINLPPGGAAALSKFISDDLARDAENKPRVVAKSTDPAGLFYAAISEYNLLHTCNTWAIDALHSAGLNISSDGVIFSGQALERINDLTKKQCLNQPIISD